MRFKTIFFIIFLSVLHQLESIQVPHVLCTCAPLTAVLHKLARPSYILSSRSFSTKNRSHKTSPVLQPNEFLNCWSSIAQLEDTRKKVLKAYSNQYLPKEKNIFDILEYAFISVGTRAYLSRYTIPLKGNMLKTLFNYNQSLMPEARTKQCVKTLIDYFNLRRSGYIVPQEDVFSSLFSSLYFATTDFIPLLKRWQQDITSFTQKTHTFATYDTNPFTAKQTPPPSYMLSLVDVENRIKNSPAVFFRPYQTMTNSTDMFIQCTEDIHTQTGASIDDIKEMMKRVLIQDKHVLRTLHPDNPAGSHALFIVANNLRDELKMQS